MTEYEDADPGEWEGSSDPCDVEFLKIVKETPKAWLLLFDDSDFLNPKREWIPKSVAEMDEEGCFVTIPEWLVSKKGLWDFADV